MTTALERLLDAIPPPSDPIHAEANWSAIEESLGWELPTDYKLFIKHYGSGGFFPVEVFVWNLSYSFPDHNRIISDLQFMEDTDDGTPFPEKLKKTPVYLWGQDGVGSKYLWAREGEPDDWHTIVTMGRLDYHTFPNLSLSEFLAKILVERDSSISSRIWGDVKTRPIHFKPCNG